jgi:tRNA (guanosine-2'-O-)-methyltransferase
MDRYKTALVRHLSQFVTEKRWELFQRILSGRTRYITVALEDIYQSQNASAVLRTCDCTGIQDVHIIENRNEYAINPDVTLGSDQWLTLRYYNVGDDNTAVAINELRKRGYRIVATSPHLEGTFPESFAVEKGRAAFLFGTELNGLSDRALELADEYIRIPMEGFTESFNISVSAAIILYQVRKKLELSDAEWKIGEEERTDILLQWLRNSINKVEAIEQEFKKNYPPNF